MNARPRQHFFPTGVGLERQPPAIDGLTDPLGSRSMTASGTPC
jgi:hypothetical protein